MPELSELYRQLILDHGRAPRGLGRLAGATHRAAGENPLCGDALHVELALAGGIVTDLGFTGTACVVATASASLLTECLRGRTVGEARALVGHMRALCGRPCSGADARPAAAGREVLEVFRAVRRFPLRVKCALLAWETAWQALEPGVQP